MIVKVVDVVLGIRISARDEELGIDLADPRRGRLPGVDPRSGTPCPDPAAPTTARARPSRAVVSPPHGVAECRPSPDRRLRVAPLYDPAFEHDACGIGFVADAGGRNARPGPAARARRARGARPPRARSGPTASRATAPASRCRSRRRSSRRSLAGRPGRRAARRSSSCSCRGPVRRAAARARALVADALAAEGLAIVALATRADRRRRRSARRRPRLPAGRSSRRSSAGRSTPATGRPISDAAFERRLVLARRRLETAARAAGLDDVSRPVGVVPDDRLQGPRRRRPPRRPLPGPALAPIRVRYALFHQRYATNTQPTWRLAQPFRSIAHNGEINTVRGNRAQVRGRAGDAIGGARGGRARARRRPGRSSPPDGSDSQSLDEMLELLVATGWDLGLGAPRRDARGARRCAARRIPHVATLRRGTAGLLAPWDGPAAIVFSDGRRVGAIVDRNGLRPAAFAVTRDRLVAVASEAGAIPLAPADTVRRGRLGPGRDAPRRPAARADPRGRRREGPPPPPPADPRRAAAGPRRPGAGDDDASRPATPSPLRYLAGLDAEKARLDIKTMVLEGHEPLWIMGDDTPTPGLGRVDRPVADHLRQSFAQVTNPPIDPERERAVMDLRVDLGRRPALLGGPPRVAPVADAPPRPAGRRRPRRAPRARSRAGSAGSTRPGPGRRGPAGLAAALDRLAADAVARRPRPARSSSSCRDRGFSARRLPIPSILAVGAVNTALTEAGLRGRTDILVDAADILDVHALAMALAAGATARRPVARGRARGRDGRHARRGGARPPTTRSATCSRRSRRASARRSPGWGSARSPRTSAGSLFETIELDDDAPRPLLPGRAGLAGTGRAAPTSPSAQLRRARRRRRDRRRRRRRTSCRTRASPASGPTARPTSSRRRSRARSRRPRRRATRRPIDAALDRYRVGARRARRRSSATASASAGRAASAAVALADVEPARDIVRRFVVSAMSVGALSPEAHQALTIGIQRAGGAANTGEGGEDPAWYVPTASGERHDARIKQVASARFGVTATYLARADQLEIKIAQGSKPGEGGQLPGEEGDGLHRGAPPRPARDERTSARRRTTTSTRSRTSPS